MGGGASKEQKSKDAKALHHNLEHFNPKTIGVFQKLHLSNEALNTLWKTFHAIAAMDETSVKENGGRAYEDQEISYQEFHDYYDLGTNYFSKIVFSRMDYGDSGEINFEEYVFSLWDFLTNDLHHFVFQVFDKDDSKFLTRDEMEQIMLCSYGVHFDDRHNAKADEATYKLLKKTAINAVNIADLNRDQKITFEEYEFFTKANGLVEQPGSEMQEKLCRANGGFKFWNALKKQRAEQHKTNSIHAILKKHSWNRREKKKKRKHHKKKEKEGVAHSDSKPEKIKKCESKIAHVSDEEAAATKIQAIHRGRSTRKKKEHGKHHGNHGHHGHHGKKGKQSSRDLHA